MSSGGRHSVLIKCGWCGEEIWDKKRRFPGFCGPRCWDKHRRYNNP